MAQRNPTCTEEIGSITVVTGDGFMTVAADQWRVRGGGREVAASGAAGAAGSFPLTHGRDAPAHVPFTVNAGGNVQTLEVR
jgi:hypothetical protein